MNVEQWGFGVNEDDHLVIGGCDTLQLAQEFDTPLHVVDKGMLLETYNSFVRAFENPAVEVETYYSYKTNCLPGMLQILHALGAGAEVVSHYELWLAIRLGVKPEKIILNGPNKSHESLRLAVEYGVKIINIDSMNEIDEIEAIASSLGKTVAVGVRVKPPIGWDAQFGLRMENGEALEACERMSRCKHLDVQGMHTHMGSGIRSPAAYLKALEAMLGFSKTLRDKMDITPMYIDVGGGFGSPTVTTFSKIGEKLYSFFNNVPQYLLNDVPPIESFADEIIDATQRICSGSGLPTPVVVVEPGRALTGSSQVLLLTIGVLKNSSSGHDIAIADGGRMTIAHPVSYEYHEVFLANRMSAQRERKYRVTGSLCTPADVLFRNKRLPVLREGDMLAIMDAGAYFTSLSNNFAFARPPVVLASNGNATELRKRESFEHLTALDAI
jgi:diaminopimelate decarboxylase